MKAKENGPKFESRVPRLMYTCPMAYRHCLRFAPVGVCLCVFPLSRFFLLEIDSNG